MLTNTYSMFCFPFPKTSPYNQHLRKIHDKLIYLNINKLLTFHPQINKLVNPSHYVFTAGCLTNGIFLTSLLFLRKALYKMKLLNKNIRHDDEIALKTLITANKKRGNDVLEGQSHWCWGDGWRGAVYTTTIQPPHCQTISLFKYLAN